MEPMDQPDDKASEITREDIDKFVYSLMNNEIKPKQCFKCSKKYLLDIYGDHINECDECWFKRFPKEEVEEFYRSFF